MNIFLIITWIAGNIVEPSLFGSAFELHPVIVMFCLVVWTLLWGIAGAILSVFEIF